MINIEDKLKKLNSLNITPSNEEFKFNLRKRLLNQYEANLADVKSDIDELPHVPSWVQRINVFLKYNSAFNLGVFFFSSILLLGSASYAVLPSNLKNEVNVRVQSFVSGNSIVEFEANIDEAQVYVNGEFRGLTPVKLSLPEGNYAVKIQKDGYGVFSDSLSLSQKSTSKISASLQKLDTTEGNVYAGWMKYTNESLGFGLNYPNDWQIAEKIDLSSPDSNFVVEIVKNSDKIEVIYKPKEDFYLSRKEGIETYKKDLMISSQQVARYLQFDTENKLVGGGFETTTANGNFVVKYSSSTPKSELLISTNLSEMDKIVQSLQNVDKEATLPAEVVDSTNGNAQIDLNQEEVSKITQLPAQSDAVHNTDKIYENQLYGLRLGFDENYWDITTSRANYPLTDRAHVFEEKGKDYEVAKVRLKASSGEINIYMAPAGDANLVYPSNMDACASTAKVQIAEVAQYKYIKNNESATEFQVCSKDDKGVFEFRSNTNGSVIYAIFAQGDIQDTEFARQLSNVISSLNFDNSIVRYKIDDIRYKFEDKNNSIQLQYHYKWDVVEESCDSADTACAKLRVVDEKDAKVLEIFKGVKSDTKIEVANYFVEKQNLNVGGKVVEFVKYMDRKCGPAPTDPCVPGDMYIAHYVSENTELVLSQDPSSNSRIIEMLASLRY